MSMIEVNKSIEDYEKSRKYTFSLEARESFHERMTQPESEGYFEFLLNGAYGEAANTFFYFCAYQGGKSRRNWKAIAFQEVAYAEGVCEDTGSRLSPAAANKVWRSLSKEVQERLNKALDELIVEYPLPGRFPDEYKEKFDL